jgi:flavin reductase (DIM6/NTAB) family NADH-FMN oxidoreductase RutF
MIKTLEPSALAQQELHSILLTAVAPRPICFASTVDSEGRVNLSPFSYFNVFSSNPPILIFSPARSGRDNTTKHSHDNVKEVPEVVINMVNHAMVEQMSLASTAYGKGINEFEKAGFTQMPSTKVAPPRVGEAPVAFECSVTEVIELDQTPGAGNLVLCKVELIHLNEDYLSGGQLDTQKLDLVGRMGGSWYTRASGASLFEIPKPLRTLGIGVSALPKGTRESEILTGNNLGRLGNLEALPSSAAVAAMAKDDELVLLAKKVGPDKIKLKRHLHWLAQRILEAGETEKALTVLLHAENL